MSARDMSKAQFRAALKRHGFEEMPWGLHFHDTTGVDNTHWGAIIKPDYSVHHRATLAMLIQKRDAAKREKSQRPTRTLEVAHG